MNNKCFLNKCHSVILGLALVLILSLSLVSGSSYAKYSKTIVLEGAVTYDPAVQLTMADLSLAEPVDIQLIPGTTITLGTSVSVNWREDAVPVFLYVELTGYRVSELTLDENWTKLGVDGREVFVYKNGTVLNDSITVPVSAKLELGKDPVEENHTLTYQAYLVEKKDGATAEDTFAAMGGTNAPVSVQKNVAQNLKAVKTEIENSEDYTVTNTGDIPVYVRAFVNPCWKNAEGEYYGDIPELTLTPGSDWQVVDDFYYYKGALAVGDTTGAIFTIPVNELTPPEEGYTLQFDVLVNEIQANPDNAVQDAWGMSYNEGIWAVYNP